MEKIYSIEEILAAVKDLQNKKNVKIDIDNKNTSENNSSIPKNTLKLLEDAENIKN